MMSIITKGHKAKNSIILDMGQTAARLSDFRRMESMEKVRNKAEGYILVEAVLGIITFTLLSMAFMTIFSGSFNQLAAARVAAQAQQYAELDAELLRLVNYEYLNDDSVLAEYSLHKARGAIQSVADAGSWQDEIIIGNETYTADGETNKYRIATINVYRNSSDTLPRASLEVPLSSQASGMPIGTVITWPTDGNPSYGGEWLECNGQEVPYKYTALRKLMTRVPDYRGMFLRGHGSQSYSQNNGDAPSNTTHTSGNVGQIQGDAMRVMYTNLGGNQWGGTFDPFVSLDQHLGVFEVKLGNNTGVSSYPRMRLDPRINVTTSGPFDLDLGWYNALTKWKYTLNYSVSSDEDGNQVIDSIELNEEEIHPDLVFYDASTELIFDNSLQMATDNEIRPVNVAVKFFIKAR